MFKCKIDITAYNKKDTTAPDVELGKAKALAKAAVKKLAGKPGEKTSFFLTKDYFENKGKPVGHFVGFGTNKKLTKHFLMKEMKGKDDAVAKDAKSASTGDVYVEVVNGKNVLHFVPNDKSKVPAGQWPKLLKALKAFFAGLKAVVVLGGQVLEEEEGGEVDKEDTGVFTPDTSVDADADTDEDEDDADVTVDLVVMKTEAKKLLAAVKAFVTTEMADVQANKSVKTILTAWRKGSAIANKFTSFLENAEDSADLKAEIAAAQNAEKSISKILTQLKPTVDKIEAKKGEKDSNVSLDDFKIDIAGKIQDIFKNFAGDIDGIAGLKDLMNSIK